VEGAAADAEPTALLEARAEAAGAPAEVLLQLGRRRIKGGDEAGAAQLLARAQKAAAATSPLAAEADWELRRLQLRQLLRDEPRKAMVEHLNRFASGPSADAAFAALSRLGPADAASSWRLGGTSTPQRAARPSDSTMPSTAACAHRRDWPEAERGRGGCLSLTARTRTTSTRSPR